MPWRGAALSERRQRAAASCGDTPLGGRWRIAPRPPRAGAAPWPAPCEQGPTAVSREHPAGAGCAARRQAPAQPSGATPSGIQSGQAARGRWSGLESSGRS